jgi:hypothetical protein
MDTLTRNTEAFRELIADSSGKHDRRPATLESRQEYFLEVSGLKTVLRRMVQRNEIQNGHNLMGLARHNPVCRAVYDPVGSPERSEAVQGIRR